MDTILCERRTYADKPYTHTHPYGQLIVPIHGSLSVTVGQVKTGEEQSVIFIPPEAAHSFYARTSNQFFVIDAPLGYLPRDLDGLPRFYPLDGRWKALRALLSEEVGDGPVSSQRLADLFRYISGLLEDGQDSASLAYIRENFTTSLTVQRLAELEHFHPTYYVEWFKRRFGKSPIAYIRDLRLHKAKELLQHTAFSVLQIAQQVGYENQSTLTRLFRQDLGMTPRQYREKSRGHGK
ncbi:MAG: AraC family transcriptional regulator [Negativicutes bacterium]|nr:AraC family transcriptional regulator [Negativicutes bacterium]